MKKLIGFILCICICCGVSVNCYAEGGLPLRLEETIGNVIFNANIYGGEISQAAMHNVAVKQSDANLDSAIIELFNHILFRDDLDLNVFEERTNEEGQVTERLYYTDAAKESEVANYFFYDGAIGANTYESTYYYGIMDIMVLTQYSGACYIPDRITCGDLPMMTVAEVEDDLRSIAEQLDLDVQLEPYIVRAYTMDEELLSRPGIQPYLQMVIQGNDLTAENWKIVSAYGSDCYFIAYRYEFDRIPVSYSYHYIESKDYSTLPSYVQALYNNDGMIRFFAYNQFSILESSEYQTLITTYEAAKSVASHLNQILGVEPFVCKEISLEYVPFAYEGCDIEREALLTPCWVFYFDGYDVMPIMVNAFNGEIME